MVEAVESNPSKYNTMGVDHLPHDNKSRSILSQDESEECASSDDSSSRPTSAPPTLDLSNQNLFSFQPELDDFESSLQAKPAATAVAALPSPSSPPGGFQDSSTTNVTMPAENKYADFFDGDSSLPSFPRVKKDLRKRTQSIEQFLSQSPSHALGRKKLPQPSSMDTSSEQTSALGRLGGAAPEVTRFAKSPAEPPSRRAMPPSRKTVLDRALMDDCSADAMQYINVQSPGQTLNIRKSIAALDLGTSSRGGAKGPSSVSSSSPTHPLAPLETGPTNSTGNSVGGNTSTTPPGSGAAALHHQSSQPSALVGQDGASSSSQHRGNTSRFSPLHSRTSPFNREAGGQRQTLASPFAQDDLSLSSSFEEFSLKKMQHDGRAGAPSSSSFGAIRPRSTSPRTSFESGNVLGSPVMDNAANTIPRDDLDITFQHSHQRHMMNRNEFPRRSLDISATRDQQQHRGSVPASSSPRHSSAITATPTTIDTNNSNNGSGRLQDDGVSSASGHLGRYSNVRSSNSSSGSNPASVAHPSGMDGAAHDPYMHHPLQQQPQQQFMFKYPQQQQQQQQAYHAMPPVSSQPVQPQQARMPYQYQPMLVQMPVTAGSAQSPQQQQAQIDLSQQQQQQPYYPGAGLGQPQPGMVGMDQQQQAQQPQQQHMTVLPNGMQAMVVNMPMLPHGMTWAMPDVNGNMVAQSGVIPMIVQGIPQHQQQRVNMQQRADADNMHHGGGKRSTRKGMGASNKAARGGRNSHYMHDNMMGSGNMMGLGGGMYQPQPRMAKSGRRNNNGARDDYDMVGGGRKGSGSSGNMSGGLPNGGHGPGAIIPPDTPLESVQGNVFQLSQEQNGCRYLQQKVDSEGVSACTKILAEVDSRLVQLMMDPFGNYLFQKLLEHANPDQRSEMLVQVKSNLVHAALNLHGTRSVQKFIEVCGRDASGKDMGVLIEALSPYVTKLSMDTNGNHVVQRCLQHMPGATAQFVYDTVVRDVLVITRHRHGCCVFQRCIDAANDTQREALVHQVIDHAIQLMQDPFGNYVVQYVLERARPGETNALIQQLLGGLAHLSMQKFSSNVVEKCLQAASTETLAPMIKELSEPSTMRNMLHDQFANYVVQRALVVANDEQGMQLVASIRPHLAGLGSFNQSCARRVASKVVKRFPELNSDPAFSDFLQNSD